MCEISVDQARLKYPVLIEALCHCETYRQSTAHQIKINVEKSDLADRNFEFSETVVHKDNSMVKTVVNSFLSSSKDTIILPTKEDSPSTNLFIRVVERIFYKTDNLLPKQYELSEYNILKGEIEITLLS